MRPQFGVDRTVALTLVLVASSLLPTPSCGVVTDPISQEPQQGDVSSRAEQKVLVRKVWKSFLAPAQKEGAGFVIQRAFPTHHVSDYDTDPYLMLDEFGPKKADASQPGAPWHPHRGFDTVTYMKSGCSEHQDSLGNKGFMRAGEVQWMHTGSGIIHDEGSPKGWSQEKLVRECGPLKHGYQMWVNVPSAAKMTPPSYTHLTDDTFSWKPWGLDAKIKLFAGHLNTSATTTSTNSVEGSGGGGVADFGRSPLDNLPIPILFADVTLEIGRQTRGADDVSAQEQQKVAEEEGEPMFRWTTIPIDPAMETCMIYVYEGSGYVDLGGRELVVDGAAEETDDTTKKRKIKRTETVIFHSFEQREGSDITTTTTTPTVIRLAAANRNKGLKFLIMAGKKIREPIARQGPFVMNTQEEIRQAIEDYQAGRLDTNKARSEEL